METIKSKSFAASTLASSLTQYLVVRYTKDAASMVQQYDLSGNLVRDIDLPLDGIISP